MKIVKPDYSLYGAKPESDESECAESGSLDFQQPNEPISVPSVEGKKRRRSELTSEKKAQQIMPLVTDSGNKGYSGLLAKGVRLLSMREHGVKEITKKLLEKSDNSPAVYSVVDELLEKDYLSEERFVESYVRSRRNRGFGPVKIRAELIHKSVSIILIEEYLDMKSARWYDNAKDQYNKKYGDSPVCDYNTWSKQARFLQGRGFTSEHIQVTLPQIKAEY